MFKISYIIIINIYDYLKKIFNLLKIYVSTSFLNNLSPVIMVGSYCPSPINTTSLFGFYIYYIRNKNIK